MDEYPEDVAAPPYEDEEEAECGQCGQMMRLGDMDRCSVCSRYVCVAYRDCMQIFCPCGRNYCANDVAVGRLCCASKREDEEGETWK